MCMLALFGRAAEDVVFNVVSTGAQNDMERVTQMAHQQVSVFGMSEAIGPLSFGGGDDNQLFRPYSEKTAQLIDHEVNSIVSVSYARSVALLEEHKVKLHALAEALLEKEVIGSEDLVRTSSARAWRRAKSIWNSSTCTGATCRRAPTSRTSRRRRRRPRARARTSPARRPCPRPREAIRMGSPRRSCRCVGVGARACLV